MDTDSQRCFDKPMMKVNCKELLSLLYTIQSSPAFSRWCRSPLWKSTGLVVFARLPMFERWKRMQVSKKMQRNVFKIWFGFPRMIFLPRNSYWKYEKRPSHDRQSSWSDLTINSYMPLYLKYNEAGSATHQYIPNFHIRENFQKRSLYLLLVHSFIFKKVSGQNSILF